MPMECPRCFNKDKNCPLCKVAVASHWEQVWKFTVTSKFGRGRVAMYGPSKEHCLLNLSRNGFSPVDQGERDKVVEAQSVILVHEMLDIMKGYAK